LHADKTYDHPELRRWVRGKRVGMRVARKGVESSERLGRHHWVIERTMSWLSGYWRLSPRYERDPDNYPGFLTLAAACPARAHASKVAASMGFSSAGTTKLVARLEDKGMIDRVRDPEDGRAFQVALTDTGQAALRAGLKAHIPRLDTEVVTRLTANQRRQLQDLLSRIDPGERTPTPRPDTQ
jgi:DNA-binding MarR family transcriptional regulator